MEGPAPGHRAAMSPHGPSARITTPSGRADDPAGRGSCKRGVPFKLHLLFHDREIPLKGGAVACR